MRRVSVTVLLLVAALVAGSWAYQKWLAPAWQAQRHVQDMEQLLADHQKEDSLRRVADAARADSLRKLQRAYAQLLGRLALTGAAADSAEQRLAFVLDSLQRAGGDTSVVGQLRAGIVQLTDDRRTCRLTLSSCESIRATMQLQRTSDSLALVGDSTVVDSLSRGWRKAEAKAAPNTLRDLWRARWGLLAAFLGGLAASGGP